MDESACSICGRRKSLKDLADSSFKVIDGKVYCPACQLKLAQPRRMRCPSCGEQTTVVLHDGKYTCTRCGEEIGGRQDSGVITLAQPAATRKAAQDDAVPLYGTGPAVPPRARRKRDRTRQVLAIALSCFIACTFILGALLLRAHLESADRPPSERQKAPQLQAEPEPANRDHEHLEYVKKRVAAEPKNYERAIERCQRAIKGIKDPMLRLEAEDILDTLQDRMDQAAKLRRQKAQQLAAQLQDKDREIARLNKVVTKYKAAQVAAATKKIEPPSTPKTTPPVPPVPDPEERERIAAAAYRTAINDAQKLAGAKKFGLAMKAMVAVANDFSDTAWGKKADIERKHIRNRAYEVFNKLSVNAKTLAKSGDYAGARELYAQALGFGLPLIVRTVEQRLAEIRQAESGGGKTPEPKDLTAAAVKKLIALLKSKKEFERSDAAKRLGEHGDRSAVPHLIDALKDEKWYVRSSAALSLGKLGDTVAIPALVDALDDKKSGVTYDARLSLRKLTGQNFTQRDKAKWRAWYDANKDRLAQLRKAAPVLPKTTFSSTVLKRRPAQGIVGVDIPKGVTVAPGARLEVLRDGKRVCDLLIASVTAGEALGKITDMERGAKLDLGDKITVRLPK